jgi:hypothetical protein
VTKFEDFSKHGLLYELVIDVDWCSFHFSDFTSASRVIRKVHISASSGILSVGGLMSLHAQTKGNDDLISV